MRTFIAIRIHSNPRLEQILDSLAGLRPALKTVPVDQLHVTLAFLGDTTESQLRALGDALHDVATTEHPFELKMRGLGTFPDASRISIVWAAFVNPDAIVRMASELGSRCHQLGFPRESRPFSPHLTLARVKSGHPRTLVEFICERSESELGAATISKLELYRSDLRPDGPHYTSLVAAPLCPASD